MDIIIKPSNLKGCVEIPSSKSLSHRAVICASLSNGVNNIYKIADSQDINATCSAMRSMGVNVNKVDNNLKIEGSGKLHMVNCTIDCFESGSTLRFIIPLGALTGRDITFTGRGKLIERPLTPYYEIFEKQGIEYINYNGKLPLIIKGVLKPDDFQIPGNISSQFISGLLFALPLLKGNSRIIITSELESKPYVDLTIDLLERHSVFIKNNDYKEFIIEGNQKYQRADYKVEGDYSQAAFWLVAGTLGSDVYCEGLRMNSIQGDKAIIDIINNMNGKVVYEKDSIKALPSSTIGTTIDVSQCPDLVPVLAVLGSLSEGVTKIINAERLRIKESDRLKAISTELNKLGAEIEEKQDGLIIKGREYLNGGEVESWNDHRIAMALAVASIKCKNSIIIKDADCVNKSYPHFWKHFKELGGYVYEG